MNGMNENFDEFDKYAMSFNFEEDMIAYKYNHSYRVMHQSDEISYSLNLDEDDNYLACLIGLLHDFARFEQWTKYKSFDDKKTFDHGDEALKLLFDDGLIKNYKLSNDNYDIVKKAIKYHNKYSIPEGLSVKEKLHCQIIRDADKLDILYAFSNPRILEIKEDDSLINDKVKDDFLNHKVIKSSDVKSANDKIVLFLSFVYDINYDYSRSTILENKYYEKMFDEIKDKDKFKPYFDEAINYLKESVKNA